MEKLAGYEETDPRRARLREQIIGWGLPLADHVAQRFSHRGIEVEDLRQVAYVGLVHAVDRFDAGLGSSFLGFAVPTIMGEVRRHFRDHGWSVRVPRGTKELQAKISPVVDVLTQQLGREPRPSEIAAELGVELPELTRALVASNAYTADSLDTAYRDTDAATDAPMIARLGAEEPCYRLLEDAMAIRPLLARLPRRDYDVLVMRFFANLNQSQIAERVGCSQMHVSRILTRTLTRLREQALAEPEPTTRSA